VGDASTCIIPMEATRFFSSREAPMSLMWWIMWRALYTDPYHDVVRINVLGAVQRCALHPLCTNQR
jgi:hypothetical protein